MSEIDELFLNEFLNWHLDKGNSINSAGIDLRNIRAIFNRAIDNRLITADIYPFRKFKIPSKKTRKRSLVPEHIKKIYAAELKGKQAQARDIFMLVFFLIGINLKDLYNLKPDNIEGERLVYERAKTHKQYSIFIHPEAMEIINRYRDEDDVRLLSFYKQYSRPYEFVKATNKFLDKFIPGLGINDKVTSYYARHSWATIAYNIGIDKDTVRLALGHGAESVTDTYIDFDLKLVDAANRKVIDSII
jgi:integrase